MTAETVELPPPLNDGFDQPQEISAVQQAFPGSVVGTLMPPMSAVPDEFKRNRANDWSKFVSDWFFHGNPFDKWTVYMRDDVDGQIAFTHLRTLLSSFEPKHEHKEAAVAWLASRWFAAIRPKEQAK